MNASASFMYAVHPGVHLKEELDAREWSQRDFAFIVGKSEQELSPILNGKRSISADMARLLGEALGINPQTFLNLQAEYDLQTAKTPDPGVRVRASLQGQYPIREMIRRGWLQDGEASLIKLQVDRFFNIANDDFSKVSFAAKKTHYNDTTPTQIAWVYRVRQLAAASDIQPYSEEKLRAALQKLKTLLIHPESVSEVPSILETCGVRFVVVETLPGAKIDGVCTWLDDQKPVIGMSTLYDRVDNFWFVLRHEIEHVLRGHGKKGIGAVDNFSEPDEDTTDQEEILANKAAAEFCIPQVKIKSFYLRKDPYFSERDVVGFASLNGIHPGIVVGQLQKLMKRYNYLRKYLVPMRKHLESSATIDGWGNTISLEL